MPKSILIVEDNILLGETLQRVLKLLEYNSKICNTLQEAKAAIDQQDWDIIISDYSLDIGTGVDVMNHAISAKSKATLIISSGYERSLFEEQLEGLSQILWLNKPYRVEDLVELLN